MRKVLSKCLEEPFPENFISDLKEYSFLSISKNGDMYSVMIKDGLGRKKSPFFIGSKEELLKLSMNFERLSSELKNKIK